MTSEYPQLLEISDRHVSALTFTANGEHLVGGGGGGVRVWRVKDGKLVATMLGKDISCVAASNDGRWIAGASYDFDLASQKLGAYELLVWDARTNEQVFSDRFESARIVDVDFSPDSSCLVGSLSTINGKTIFWDIGARRRVRTLDHDGPVFGAKYSPRGDRVAIADCICIQVWDSSDGQLLVDINMGVGESHRLLWHNNHLFVLTRDSTIMEIDATTGSTVSEWAVPHPDYDSCLALPQHGKFIAYVTMEAITFWDTATHAQFSHIQFTQQLIIPSVAFSPNGQLLAITESEGTIIRDITSVFPSVSEPALDIDITALDAWKHGHLTGAEASLSATMPTSKNMHHALASRALIRARLGQWDASLVDAEKSVQIQRSVIGYIARCVALVGKGETQRGCEVCDIGSLHFPLDRVCLFLIKDVVLFMAGKHTDAMTCMNNIIADGWVDPALYVVQAYMHVILGNKFMESNDYEPAIQAFEDARIKLGNCTRQPPLIVSLVSGWHFDDLAITIQHHLCEALLAAGHTEEADKSILRLVDQEINMTEPTKTWVSDFRLRCRGKAEALGDSAVNAKEYGEAISQYTVALSLDPPTPQHLYVKRSKSYAGKGSWNDALKDADEVIELDPSSPTGYERKHQALRGAGHHADATDAFEMMLVKMSESPDSETRERSRQYVRPEATQKVIRTAVLNAVRHSPPVLINSISGRLCSKPQQISAFETMPIFTELICSMTTRIDHALIVKEVGKFYRYATLSHTWEGDEPLYEKVIKIAVYDLEASPTHDKLQMFCKIVRDEGFYWAWSDTCCIDKGDHFVLQEALVRMFKWYEGSAVTIIFLYDVDQQAELDALMRSKWNSRGWTLQEYHASKVVRIYTKDWRPYLGLAIYNHKEAPEIISEMEKATGISAESLKALRPGLNNIREKLRLASTRQTTRVEDAAYSLLGIFSMSLPVTYGEEDKALGRLLSQLLMSSGDTSILAWSGESGSFNSCLPASIVVFSQPVTSHIPPAIPDVEMNVIIAGLHALSLDLDLVTTLYDRVDRLHTPTFAGQRMRLPCLAFGVRLLSRRRVGSEFVFCVQADALGTVDIKTEQNFTPEDSLYLVHPWIDFLLGRRATGKGVQVVPPKNETSESDDFVLFDSSPHHPSISYVDSRDAGSLPSSSTLSPMDMPTRVYKFLARLQQPFGALLLVSNPQNEAEFGRVATESLITVQVGEITPATLNRLIQSVRELDVL